MVDAAAESIPGPAVRFGGARSFVSVPILKGDELIGVISIYRQEIRPFTDKQIELVKNFAVQAVIAIENARLLNELRQRTDDLSHRTDDLTEALEQQTATSEVLRVISSSPGELNPVFDAMLENAIRICDAKFGHMLLFDGELFTVSAMKDTPRGFANYLLSEPKVRPYPGSYIARLVEARKTVHVPDAKADKPYVDGQPRAVAAVDLGGARTQLFVPMIKEGDLLGSIHIYRQEVRPLTDKQIALVQNFAAQAVIAIENTRLLNELRGSLDRQTATSEVLRVISSSPGDLQPVFSAILKNATRICQANFGTLYLREDGAFRVAALHNAPAAFVEARRREPLVRPQSGNPMERVVTTKQALQISDVQKDPALEEPNYRLFATLTGARSSVTVPMLKKNEAIGVVTVYRLESSSFTDEQTELLTNFAAQAVIAIENTRLLNELRQRTADLSESLEQQTATSEVLKVIGSSPGDLQPVFSAMLESAARLCDASFGNIFRWDNDALRLVATYNTPVAFVEARSRLPLRRGENNPIGEMLTAKTVLHVDDLAADERYTKRRNPNVIAAVELGGVRTLLAVPMLKDDELIGALIVYRQEVRPFSDKQINWSRTSPPRPSSPSRTHGCLTSCANHYSSRLRLPTY
jgi:GAF domain-containing protein